MRWLDLGLGLELELELVLLVGVRFGVCFGFLEF